MIKYSVKHHDFKHTFIFLTLLQSTHSIQLSALVFKTREASLIHLYDLFYVFTQQIANRQKHHDLNEESCVVSLLFSLMKNPIGEPSGI